ncbi:MAG: type IVB secretion system lipoprotein DotD [Coxiellaceae bacterium]|nr:type IVB secretion system lipoprotein DotD [Coxiellaceae bacterium]
MKIKLISLALLAFVVAGCSTPRHRLVLTYITTKSAPVQTVDKNSQMELAEAAVSVGKSLQNMAAIDLAIHPKVKLGPPLNPKLVGMDQQTSINWTGPIEPLLHRIADASRYKLHVLGNPPAIPVIVQILAENQPLSEIVRDVRYQSVKKARIKIYPVARVIELRYFTA